MKKQKSESINIISHQMLMVLLEQCKVIGKSLDELFGPLGGIEILVSELSHYSAVFYKLQNKMFSGNEQLDYSDIVVMEEIMSDIICHVSERKDFPSKTRWYVFISHRMSSYYFELLEKISKESREVLPFHYYFQKRCRVCERVYFVNEITEEAFEQLKSNDNILIQTDGYNFNAEITSCCESCSKLEQS